MAENQNIEWKQSWRDEYLKWICGFANAQGGKIYIGCYVCQQLQYASVWVDCRDAFRLPYIKTI